MNDIQKPDADAVVCCPACRSQYAVHSSMAGQLGRCGRCRAHFAINVTELKLDGGPAIVFDDALSIRWEFFREGCGEMARNTSALLRLAGEPVTPGAVMRIVESIPRKPDDLRSDLWRGRACNVAMERAHGAAKTSEDRRQISEIIGYFTGLTIRSDASLDMLQGAFLGVLGEIEFDAPNLPDFDQTGREPALSGPQERGFLSRCFARPGRNH